MSYDEKGVERKALMDEFTLMLWAVTGDGARKRSAGLKPPWWQDGSHWPALFTHLAAYEQGNVIDKDSGVHTLVHLAWRALAIAYIESAGGLDKIHKTCPACEETKPLSAFVRGSKTAWFGRGSYCKPCHASKVRAAKYNRLPSELDAMLAAQGNRCAICRRQRKSDSREFAVDHDHNTGVIRGVLCGECNTGLGMFHDNISTLFEAIRYLNTHQPDEDVSEVFGGVNPVEE